jgi:glycosyltransferase involved in cell wall biosynthesis
VVSYLTEELVSQGHDVTLFASGDSSTAARLVSPCARSLRLDPSCKDPIVHHLLLLERVLRQASDGEFDILHFHCDYLHYPFCRRLPVPHVTTLHGRIDLPDLLPLYEEYTQMPLVSISNSQRTPLPWLNWQNTVYHGLPLDLYEPGAGQGGYLAFVGRMSPEKGVERAIEIALRAQIELRIAAKVDPSDAEYFCNAVKPLLNHPLINFVGEIGDDEKADFFGNAIAVLFPVNWPEPFGLVMIEALACGTPVIAWRSGSVPEIINHGKSGFVVTSIEEAVSAVENIGCISRASCRECFERRFPVSLMTRNYLTVYEKLRGTTVNTKTATDGIGRRHPGKGAVLHPLDLLTS